MSGKVKILWFLTKIESQNGLGLPDQTPFLGWNFFSKGCRKFFTHFTTMFRIFRRSTKTSSSRQWKTQDHTTHQFQYMEGNVENVRVLKNLPLKIGLKFCCPNRVFTSFLRWNVLSGGSRFFFFFIYLLFFFLFFISYFFFL